MWVVAAFRHSMHRQKDSVPSAAAATAKNVAGLAYKRFALYDAGQDEGSAEVGATCTLGSRQ